MSNNKARRLAAGIETTTKVRARSRHHIGTGLEVTEAVDEALAELEVDPEALNTQLIRHLVIKTLEGSRCEVCRATLIGREIAHGTCGHCGGRSIHP